MIARKFLGLPNLTKTQVFYIYKAAKVVVIDKDKDFVLISFWIMPPYFEGLNDGKKLIVMSFILSFG